MLGDSYGLGNDRQRRIDGARGYQARSVDDLEVVQIMSFAVGIENADARIVAHAARAVLMV